MELVMDHYLSSLLELKKNLIVHFLQDFKSITSAILAMDDLIF